MNFMGTQISGFVERDQSRRQAAPLPASLSLLSLSGSRGRGFFSLVFRCCPSPFLHFPRPQAQILYLFIKLYIDPFFSEMCSKGSAVSYLQDQTQCCRLSGPSLDLLKQNVRFKQDAWVCCLDYIIAGMMLLISSHIANMFLLAAGIVPILSP